MSAKKTVLIDARLHGAAKKPSAGTGIPVKRVVEDGLRLQVAQRKEQCA